MILDHFRNIEHYEHFDLEIYKSLKHLVDVDSEIELGVYSISSRSNLIVSEYETKVEGLGKFEAHKHVIDIQYPLTGLEGIEWSSLFGMKSISTYDEQTDTTFYSGSEWCASCQIGNGVFGIFYPKDAHKPQIMTKGKSQLIKKATVKISI